LFDVALGFLPRFMQLQLGCFQLGQFLARLVGRFARLLGFTAAEFLLGLAKLEVELFLLALQFRARLGRLAPRRAG